MQTQIPIIRATGIDELLCKNIDEADTDLLLKFKLFMSCKSEVNSDEWDILL